MQDRAILTLGCWSLGVTLGLMAACAGGDTPARDDELEQQIANKYAGGGPVGSAGGAGGGTAAGGSGGGAASGAGGSSANPGTGGSTMAGEAGSGSVAAGAGGSGSSASSCDGFAILNGKCGGGACHGSEQAGGLSNFALDEQTAKGFAGETSANCASSDNAPIFDPDNPAASLVVKKITATAACGGRMPLGATTQQLTDEELTCVKDWIKTL
jgi:hypothetical protein